MSKTVRVRVTKEQLVTALGERCHFLVAQLLYQDNIKELSLELPADQVDAELCEVTGDKIIGEKRVIFTKDSIYSGPANGKTATELNMTSGIPNGNRDLVGRPLGDTSSDVSPKRKRFMVTRTINMAYQGIYPGITDGEVIELEEVE